MNCQTQRSLAGQLGDMGKIPISSSKDKPTVTSKTQLSETPASAQAPIPKSEPKPSPGNQAEEEKTISTTVAKAAVTTPAVPAPLSVVPTTTDMLQTEMTAVVAPIPATEIQKAVITAAEVTLKETDKDELPDETQVETEPMSLLPAVPTEADVVKV